MKITEYTGKQSIILEFNPPSSPHMGGSWERLVGVVKISLFNIVKDRVLTDFPMITVFTEVENMVNNRPITANSDSVDDLEALTPNHFLIGRNANDRSYLGEINKQDICSRKRWRQVQLVTQHFWNRWLREYLPTLTKRVKWQKGDIPVKVGDLVLLRDDGVKRGLWPLGRIERIHPGQDGIIRVVDVRTKSGVYVRPVVKIYPLEIDCINEVPQGGENVTESMVDG